MDIIEATRGRPEFSEARGVIPPLAKKLLPYASSDSDDWTEEQFILYSYAELAVGNRREYTKEEIAERQKVAEVDKIINSAASNSDWLKEVGKVIGDEREEIDIFEFMAELDGSISQEQLDAIADAQINKGR